MIFFVDVKAEKHPTSGRTIIFVNCAQTIRDGIDFKHFIIVKGHFRIIAFALVPEYFNYVECFVGKCSSDELNK